MPTCDARYDVVLFDGRCPGYSHGIPKTGTPMPTAVIDYAEERLPDVFGDPGRLIGAKFRRGISDSGKRVREFRPRDKVLGFYIDGAHGAHRVMARNRRYLRWAWVEPDPPVDPLNDEPA